jgi:RNA polymerase sigma-70 factor (ECF subfamily)
VEHASPKPPQKAQRAPKAEDVRRLILLDRDATSGDGLYLRLSPLVNRLIWSLLGADADRDDIAHEVFIRILRGAGRLRDPTCLEAWAARITVNTVKNEFRKRSLRRFFSWDSFSEERQEGYHPDFEGRELVTRTQRILEQLPASERIPFTLQLLDGLGVDEIAELCGCSTRTVKRRLSAARERFERLASRDPLLKTRIGGEAPSDG